MSTYISELENMTLYKKPFFAPINEEDKKKGSCIFLLTPNVESSKKVMNLPYMINNGLYNSYYTEKDITYFINQENVLVKKFDQVFNEAIHESNNPISTNMNKFISEKDIYVNFDKWESKENNVLFVTGISGSGKSTLAKTLAKKYNAEYIDLDKFRGNKHYSDSELKDLQPILFEYLSNNFKNRSDIYLLNQDEYHKEFDKYIYWLADSKKRVIIEGVQVAQFIYENKQFTDYPIVFKGTSKYKSILRRLERDGIKNTFNGIIKTLSLYNRWENEQNITRQLTITKDNHKEVNESVVLESMNKEDYKAALEIFNSLSKLEKEWVAGRFVDSPDTVYGKIHKVNGKNAGFIEGYVFPEDPDNVFVTIAIKKEYRGKGISNKLINGMIQSLKNGKYKGILWRCDNDNKMSMLLAEKSGFKLVNKNSKTHSYIYDLNNIIKESVILEEVTDYKARYVRQSKQYELTETSLQVNSKDSNCIIFFNEMLEEKYLNEAGNGQNQMLKKLLYEERIRNNKEVILLYDQIKKDVPWIKRTFIDYKFYQRFNLFIDWSYYTETFFKNNIYKLDRGVNLYFNFVNRFLKDKRLTEAGYVKKTVFVPVLDWVSADDTDTWDHTQNLNPVSMIYRIMKTTPDLLKEWGEYTFVFTSDSGYFKVDFSKFTIKDLPRFITYIKTFINKAPILDPVDTNGKESTKAIVASIVNKIETSHNITVNNLTGGTSTLTPEEVKAKLDSGITSKDDNKKAELVNLIQQAADGANSEEDAIDNMENNDSIKQILADLEAEEDNTIKMNATRSSRMVELNSGFMEKKLNNVKIKDLITKRNISKPLEVTALPIDSINEDWQKLTYVNFEKAYDIDEDIAAILYSFSDKTAPISIREIKTEDTSTSEDSVVTYTVECEDSFGQRFTLKFDMPKFKSNRFMKLRGNEKTINAQLLLLPIIKTDEDTVQIVSNYNKIFVTRYGTNTGKSFVIADRLIKTFDKMEDPNIVITFGDNSKICSKYELPIDYVDLASEYTKIEFKKYYTFYFNQDEIRAKYKVDDSKGIPFAVDTNNKIMYWTGPDTLSSQMMAMCYTLPGFSDIYDTTTVSTKYTYSKASILNTDIPVIVIMGYNEGLQTALKKGNIRYDILDKREKINKDNSDVIKFKDGFLKYDLNYNSSLLMNGLKECNTEDFSIKDMNNRSMWIEFLDLFGGRIKADGLDNFYDLMIDPITKEVCEKYKLPTDYIEILAYANMLLADNKFNRHTDITGNRFRTNEIVAGYMYKALADSYSDYKNQLKRNRKGATMTIKQSAVIDGIMLDPTAADLSILNPLLEIESANSVSFKGLSGMNSDRSYSLDKRTFDNSMINVLGMSTGFAANVGITRQSTIDMNIEGKRGYIKKSDSLNNMSAVKTLSMTEALTPFGTTRDDPFRSAMTFIQTSKHSMRTKNAMPLLVTNGADEALPYMTSDTFAHKAKADGKVSEKTDDYMIITYKDGSSEFVDLRDNVKKNSDGGFFITVKLDTDLKQGSNVKKGTVIAYDKLAYSDIVGHTDSLGYKLGALVKVAIMNTDEGFEDSAIISDWLSDAMTSEVVVKKEIVLPKNTNVYEMVKKGQPIGEGDPLIIFQNAFDEEDANLLLKNITDEDDMVSELGKIPVKSKITGIVQDVHISRTVEKEELSSSLQGKVNEYEKDIKKIKKIMGKYNIEDAKSFDADYKLDPTGKLKNAKDAVMIEFFLKYNDRMSIGDKIVYYSALKGVVKDIFPKGKEPYSDFRRGEKVHTLLGIGSVNARMVASVKIIGSINKVLIEMDRKVKTIMGLTWKNLDEME